MRSAAVASRPAGRQNSATRSLAFVQASQDEPDSLKTKKRRKDDTSHNNNNSGSPEVITTMTMLIIMKILTKLTTTRRSESSIRRSRRFGCKPLLRWGREEVGGSPKSLGTAARFAAGPPKTTTTATSSNCLPLLVPERTLSAFLPPQAAPKSSLVVRRQFVVRHSPVIASCRHLRQQTVELPAFSEQ